MKTPFIVLVISLASALMGCGSSGGSGAPAPDPAPIQVPPPEPEPEPTPEPTPEPEPTPDSEVESYVVHFNSTSGGIEMTSDADVLPDNNSVSSDKFTVNAAGWHGAFYTDWGAHDVSAFNTLDFWAKGEQGGESISISMSDGTNDAITNVQVPFDGSWQHFFIDFSMMNAVDFKNWSSITFGANGSSIDTAFYINHVQFSYVEPYTGPQITVVPWNGAQAAVSLTFDDGDGSQLDNAVPLLDAKDLDATFFITETAITGSRKNEWKALIASGHEIGNHSKHHYAPSDNPSEPHERTFDDTLGYDESVAAKVDIEQAMGTKVFTYAYPYTNNEPYIVKYLHDTHVSARGGWGANGTYYMNSSYTPDWMNVSCLFSWTEGTFENDYRIWIDDAIEQEAWIVFGIHGVGDQDWTSFPQQEFNSTVDYLDEKRDQVWIAPYVTISSYWRAQKIIEDVRPIATSTGARYSWNVPSYFPENIRLKVTLENAEGYQLVQDNQVIQPDADGNYVIAFNAASFELTNE